MDICLCAINKTQTKREPNVSISLNYISCLVTCHLKMRNEKWNWLQLDIRDTIFKICTPGRIITWSLENRDPTFKKRKRETIKVISTVSAVQDPFPWKTQSEFNPVILNHLCMQHTILFSVPSCWIDLLLCSQNLQIG